MTTRRTRLKNGLTVISEEIHDAPVVALQAWVHVGSADETDDISGIAHVHEHMLFKGTSSRGVGEIARTVEASGGEINAWTSFDQTVYHLVLAADEAETGLDILSDALRSSSFDADELAREIEVVLEEIRRADDSPSRRMAKALFDLAYDCHPYRRPVIGTEESIRALTRERILAFFRQFYRPENVTMVCVGDFETDAFFDVVRRYFEDWTGEGEPSRPERPPDPPQEQARVRVMHEEIKEARLAFAWHVPELRHEEIAAVDALSVILGDGDSSRLFLETRRRLELVNDVYAYAYTPRDPGLLMVGAGLRGEALEPALRSILEQTFALRQQLVSQDELDKAKVVILSEAAYQRETVQGQARKLGFFEVVAGDYEFEAEYNDRLRCLTPEDVRQAARRYLHPHPAVAVQLPLEVEAPDPGWLGALTRSCFDGSDKSVVRSRRTGALDVTRVELDNGTVVLVRGEDRPVVAFRGVALGGLRWEDVDGQGLGYLFASVWGRATENLSVEALAQRVALLGGSLSAFSGRNTIGMRGEVIRDKADDGLALFIEALRSSTFHAAEVDRERAVILERIRNRDDNPAVVAFDAFTRALYPTHPYGLRLIGSEESVQRFSVEDIRNYGKRFVSADKLVVSVVGGIDADRTIELIASQ
ncbi:MAG: pitrilysin family protein, partial [Myxococcota bacterium]